MTTLWANRRRCLAVLIFVIASGCGRDYVMPATKTRLRGYQIESRYAEGRALIQDSDSLRLGYMDVSGTIVIAPRFAAAGLFAEGLAPAMEEYRDGYGYIDVKGRMAIAPQFDAALPFAESLAPVRIGGTWGYIGTNGVFRIPPRFDDAYAFSEGRARVVLDGFAGFIDQTGGWVAAPVYFRAGDFHDGRALVNSSNKCGFIGKDGRVAIALCYDNAGSFADGLAPVRTNGAWGYVDRAGTMVVPPVFDQAAEFSDGIARVARIKNASFDRKFGGYTGRAPFFGFIDRTGATVIATVMLGVEPFAGGMAVVRVPARGFTTDACDMRLINRQGAFLLGRFDRAFVCGDGYAVVSRGNRSCVINSNGTPIVELDSSIPGDPEYAVRNVVNVRYGYIDTNGTQAIAHAYTMAQPFSEGLAFVEGPWARRVRARGYIDTTGALAIAVANSIAQALPFTDDRALVSEHKGTLTYGYMDRTGRMCISAQYANAGPFTAGLAPVKLSRNLGMNDWGYIDTSGTMVISPRFKDAGQFANGVAYAERVGTDHILHSAIIGTNGAVAVDKPFVMEWSHALFGVPSLEQHQRRMSMIVHDGLVPWFDRGTRGYVNVSNAMVINGGRFAYMGLFAEGRAPVSVQDGGRGDSRWTYIDTAGTIIGSNEFTFAGPFSEGMAMVRDDAGRTGYIKRDGTWAIEPMWLEDAQPFMGGRALVKLNNRHGYLDTVGRFAIPPRYLRAESFAEGKAAVAVAAPPRKAR